MDPLKPTAALPQLPTPTTPPPPAYTTINAPPADPTDEDTHLTLNCATQIRGHGNIISVPPINTTQLATLIFQTLNGGPKVPSPPSAEGRGLLEKRSGTVIVNINCGATVVGDRNIVGSGLAETARGLGCQLRAPTVREPGEVRHGAEGNADGRSPKRKAEDEAQSPSPAKKVDARAP